MKVLMSILMNIAAIIVCAVALVLHIISGNDIFIIILSILIVTNFVIIIIKSRRKNG